MGLQWLGGSWGFGSRGVPVVGGNDGNSVK